ncbi:PepSY-associated TM helix domain-containing protein [Massilia timonae]|uniref:PepSY-associated TM helix family protein n=1 Tax=Massilia timonae TaxID=47229 RepID=A0A1S2N772_9BURK|nr:PepSY-associated TM helix domain-containing protein [Massilia timonae]OIJ40464.1 pepSY-associated TM helix family protein [Massilia timonae]
MGARLKRWLFLVHRWLGIGICLLFAMWFVSGMVMMYVGYPKLTEEERLQRLPPLQADARLLAPARALAAAGVTGPLDELRLAASSGGRPVYVATPAGHKSPPKGSGAVVIDAVSGQRLRAVDEAHAMASATAFAGPGIARDYLGTIDEDAFTHSRALDPHRPLHKVQLGDAERTLLYISSRSGEVVRDATRSEQLWNYAGAWIHWLYPLRGNAFQPYWTGIVNWLSILGIAMALSGTVVGILRWRFRKPYRSGARTPYPHAMMRWHHVTGLLFALVTITWIFSGLMSMNPWRIFDTGAPPLRMEALQGSALALTDADAAPQALLAAGAGAVRELRWTRVLGENRVLAQAAGGAPRVIGSHDGQPVVLDAAALRAAAAGLLPAPVARVEQLRDYDLYYYARDAHTMMGGAMKPLPILRIVFDDPHATWVHLDPHTGAVLGRLDRGKRTSRWLFAMLHSWDWLPLLERRPLWDLVLIALSLGGTLLSVTGVVIGWRRLGRKLREARHETIVGAPRGELAG